MPFLVKPEKKSKDSLLIFLHFLYMIKGNSAIGGNDMLNYEEELAKFQPSLEIDEAEEAIMKNDLTDLSDLLEQVTTGKKDRR